MKNIFKYNIGLLLLSLLLLSGCEIPFLDAKPDKALLIPNKLQDYQALLDNAFSIMNRTPYLGEVSSDDHVMRDNSIQSYAETIQNAYRWEKRIYSGLTSTDWDLPYKQIFYANVVLEGLNDLGVKPENTEAQNTKGMALFFRAWGLYQASQLFAAPYDPKNASILPGLPVRIRSDVSLPSKRGTLQQTYDQILSDLELAIPLLYPEQITPTRPSKAAAYAFMSRLQLTMQNYNKAGSYADSTLVLNNQLLDYNTLDSTLTFPMPVLYLTSNRNPEVLFLTILISNSYLGSGINTVVDPALYDSYEGNDLRKTLFFDNNGQFTGSYIGMKSHQFSGLGVDEIYLIRAEAYARAGKTEEACADLNTLMIKRWKKGNFKPIELTDNEALLKLILLERRKQLVARGIRWSDLRRLNQESRFAKELFREIDGKQYSLSPNSNLYTFPFPDNEIAGSGIEQNPR